MEGNFRNVLIIISAIIIGAIFVHGLWTIRKNKNPYKLKASKDPVEPLERDFDRSGFDQDGVSQVRVIGKNPAEATEKATQQAAEQVHQQEENVDITRRSLANEPEQSVVYEQDVPPVFVTAVDEQSITQPSSDHSAQPIIEEIVSAESLEQATSEFNSQPVTEQVIAEPSIAEQATAQKPEAAIHMDSPQTANIESAPEYDAYEEYSNTIAQTPAEASLNNPFVIDSAAEQEASAQPAQKQAETVTANASISHGASISQEIPVAADESEAEMLAEQDAEKQQTAEPSYIDDMSFSALDQDNAQATQTAPKIEKKKLEPIFVEPVFPEPEPEPVYQAPVSQPKPQPAPQVETPTKPAVKKVSKSRSEKEALKRNQMEINFGDEAPAEKAELPSEVIALSVVVPENQIISGAALLPSLLTMGLRFGEMNIFHRHQDNAGNGKITFSLANMLNPGTFDLDAMETFATQGVSLFMTLPNEGDPFEVFSQMLAAAKQLAKEFNGQVLDDKRSVMTKQTEQHYTSKIREFDRKSRIAAL